ncbi:unnamed protein product [Allacma fusca]|uniref:DUF7869 domain-containing protein n=1 Tax=Allacma fusca TaxID=39272 RepID=A0A8J2JSH9_9HEXA|nr:unnamed protein product [Allacma fusca]
MANRAVLVSQADLSNLNKGKRRQVNPLNWKDRAKKIKKDKGLSYKILKGRKAGTLVAALIPPDGVLFVPRLSCSSAYFKRKLSTFNLGIHETGREEASMYLWDETVAEHTSKDVLSCLYKYLKDHFSPLKAGETRHLILWSDRFVGQFNNCYLLLFLKYLVDHKMFTKAEQKLFITGHSWMSCDRDFGLIEKKFVQMNPIVPDDILDVVSAARINNPFKIQKMIRSDFLNFNVLPDYVCLPKQLQVTRYHCFKYESEHPNILFAKSFHNSTEWQKFNLTVKNKFGFARLRKFPASYTSKLQINRDKGKDLRDLMEKIPDQKKYNFYDELTKFVLEKQ